MNDPDDPVHNQPSDQSHSRVAQARRRAALRSHLVRSLPFLGYLAVQVFIVAGLPTPLFVDSPRFMHLSFIGNAQEMPTVPLFYRLLLNDPLRMAGQVVLAAIAWWVLAKVASDMTNDRRVRIGLRVVILMLGVVGPIASWNSTILAESVTISLTALLAASWLYYMKGPRWSTAGIALVVTALWTFTRQGQAIDSVFIAVVGVIYALIRLRDSRRIAIAVALVCISGAGIAISGRNHYVSNYSVADIIQDRILLDPSWTGWFVNHGMPYSSAIQRSAGGIYGLALIDNPAFNAWLTARGSKTYELFLLTHPVYTLFDPLPYFSGEEASLRVAPDFYYLGTDPNPTPSMLSPTANYGRHRDVLPPVIQETLFEQGQIGDVIALAALAIASTWIAWRRKGRDHRLWIPALITLSVVPQGYVAWIGGGVGELDRISIVVAVSARIGLWIIAGLSLDRILSTRRDTAIVRRDLT